MWNRAYLSLGSNMGDKVGHLKEAVSLLESHEKISVLDRSSFYTTSPVGYLEQDDFVNAVLGIETILEPEALLEVCQAIESKLNRVRTIRWGPRTIDVDILLIDGYTSQTDRLFIPHPRMCERAFVLIPLCEINACICINGLSIVDLCRQLGEQDVRKMDNENW